MIYGPNGKGIMGQMEYNVMVYDPSGKDMVLWKKNFSK